MQYPRWPRLRLGPDRLLGCRDGVVGSQQSGVKTAAARDFWAHRRRSIIWKPAASYLEPRYQGDASMGFAQSWLGGIVGYDVALAMTFALLLPLEVAFPRQGSSVSLRSRLQAVALNSVLQAAHSESCRPGVTGPAVARPKEAPLPKETVAPREMPSRSASPVLRPGYEGQG